MNDTLYIHPCVNRPVWYQHQRCWVRMCAGVLYEGGLSYTLNFVIKTDGTLDPTRIYDQTRRKYLRLRETHLLDQYLDPKLPFLQIKATHDYEFVSPLSDAQHEYMLDGIFEAIERITHIPTQKEVSHEATYTERLA